VLAGQDVAGQAGSFREVGEHVAHQLGSALHVAPARLEEAEQLGVGLSATGEDGDAATLGAPAASAKDPITIVSHVVHGSITGGRRAAASLTGVAATQDPEVLRSGEIEVFPRAGLARAGGEPLTLSVREFGVLCALVRRQGQVVSREALFQEVWGGQMRPDDRSVDVYVHKLRVKLGAVLPDRPLIHTHFGFGYRV